MAQKITETTKLLKICYVDELKWRINSEPAALDRALLNVLLSSRVNVYRLCSC